MKGSEQACESTEDLTFSVLTGPLWGYLCSEPGPQVRAHIPSSPMYFWGSFAEPDTQQPQAIVMARAGENLELSAFVWVSFTQNHDYSHPFLPLIGPGWTLGYRWGWALCLPWWASRREMWKRKVEAGKYLKFWGRIWCSKRNEESEGFDMIRLPL